MARFPGFIGSTYKLRSLKASPERCVNLYPEIVESRNAANGEIAYLVKVPGRRLLATVGSGPIRGVYATSTNRLAVVSGNALYSVSSTWGATLVGTLATSSGPVDMVDNGLQLILVDGTSGYIASLITGAFSKITSEYFMGATRAAFIDGYFLVNNPGTGQFQICRLYDGATWDGLDFGGAEGNPDNIIAVLASGRQLWTLGAKTGEIFWNTGDADFPFSRVDGNFIEHGCGAAFSAQQFAGTIVWLSDKGQVLMAAGAAPTRISNHSVELAIRESGDFSGATAYIHAIDGHTFYCLNLPGSTTTWCYDLSTSQWHERGEMVLGQYAQSRVSCATYAHGTWVAGDAQDGRLYELDPETYANDDAPLVWERTAPKLNQAGVRLFVSQFQLDMETGIGLDGSVQGSDPQVMLQISKDGGYSWTPERWKAAGELGQGRRRVTWQRLGAGRDLIFRVRGSDPVKTLLYGANIEIEAGVA